MSATAHNYQPKHAVDLPVWVEEGHSSDQEAGYECPLPESIGKRALISYEGLALLNEVESPHRHIREELESRVVDQSQAIDAIINALDRNSARTTNRPLACLAFLGPTGVGKTETAKALADIMAQHYGGGGLIKIDCAQYSNGHEIATLIGAPPTYVGREQEPKLSPRIVEGYGKVILFDEIEKGHEKLHNLLLHIMGEGELTMNNGGEVTSFEDSIIILTSNLGASEMSHYLNKKSLGFSRRDDETPVRHTVIESSAREGFTKHFQHKPEFVNRIDNLAVFHPLSRSGLRNVLNVKLRHSNELYQDRFGTQLTLSEHTQKYLVDKALKEPQNGARPIVRGFEQEVQSHFGRYIGAGCIPDGTRVYVAHREELALADTDDGTSLVFMSQPDPSLKRTGKEVELQTLPKQIDEITYHI